jgi:hypothetical protein
MGFTKDLETIAEPQYLSAIVGKFYNTLHHWAKPGNGSTTHIVAIRKATGENNTITFGECTKVLVLVPEHDHFLVKIVLQGVLHIAVTIGAWKNYDAEFHCFDYLAKITIAPNGYRTK